MAKISIEKGSTYKKIYKNVMKGTGKSSVPKKAVERKSGKNTTIKEVVNFNDAL